MNSKIATIGIFAVLAVAAFAGILVASDASAEGETYTVTYEVDGMSYSTTQTDTALTLPTLEAIGAKAEGKTFGGWEMGGAVYSPGSQVTLTETTTVFTAKLTDTVYTATFKQGDAVLEIVEGTLAEQVDLAKEIAALVPTAEGKIFAGWQIDGKGDIIKTADLGILKGDVTYVAAFTVDFVVTFIDGDKTYVSHVSDLTVPDLGERTGFTFLGWFIGTDQVDPLTYNIVADTTFTAKWEPTNVYVTFEAGSFSTKVAVLYGETVVQPALPAGYIGWGVKNADGSITAFDFSTAITKDMTLVGIPAAPAKASGLKDPIVMTIAIIIGTLVLVMLAVFVMMVRKGKIVIGRGANVKKISEEEKKE